MVLQFSIPPVDFEGQRIIDKYSKIIMIIVTIIAFIIGFVVQDVFVMLGIFGIGLAFCVIAFGIPMPYLRAHYLTWLPAEETPKEKKQK